MDKEIETFVRSPVTVLFYFALVLVVLILLLWTARYGKAENLIGGGVDDKVFTSGATQRRLAQEFSSANQGTYGIVHNAELKELVPGIMTERLVNERGQPDFWEVSSELDAYREEQTPAMNADAQANAGGKEYLGPASIASQVEDELLRQRLYN